MKIPLRFIDQFNTSGTTDFLCSYIDTEEQYNNALQERTFLVNKKGIDSEFWDAMNQFPGIAIPFVMKPDVIQVVSDVLKAKGRLGNFCTALTLNNEVVGLYPSEGTTRYSVVGHVVTGDVESKLTSQMKIIRKLPALENKNGFFFSVTHIGKEISFGILPLQQFDLSEYNKESQRMTYF